jgi:hypothetical protein
MNKNEWIYPQDDLPEIQKGVERSSIDVTVETDAGEQHTGFYSHDGYQWYIYTRTGVQEANVTRWSLIRGD